ncbi:MAG: hypothetical protein SPL30_00785 [Succinivibrio sp.]|jgi:ribosomal protein S16|nr:hypothetical protein [Succinivibrio sp.]
MPKEQKLLSAAECKAETDRAQAWAASAGHTTEDVDRIIKEVRHRNHSKNTQKEQTDEPLSKD